MSCLIYARNLSIFNFFGRFMDSDSRNLIQKVVEGHFCMGPMEKKSRRIHVYRF
jgi:hypothetical protein